MKKFAVLGAGFWAKYQLSAWGEVAGAECVAVCDVDHEQANRLARECGVPQVFQDPVELFRSVDLDFVDIITPPATHRALVELAAKNGVHAISQKPLAETVEDAQRMIQGCDDAGVKLLVHENFRWQTPMRALKDVLDSNRIGKPFRARLHFCNSFPVFENQPLLADLEQFLLADVGVHVLDLARFFFGEAESLYCLTQRVNPNVKGEDVATVVLKMRDGVTVVNEMSYASRTKDEAFPQTFATIEGSLGCAELGKDHWLHLTTADGTESRPCTPPSYSWADPAYDVVHASLVPCNANLLSGITHDAAETTAQDNFQTLKLAYGSYRSAEENRVLDVAEICWVAPRE